MEGKASKSSSTEPTTTTTAAPAEPSKPEDAQKRENTISNLPLLFANGYPTSLEKITEAQLLKFIPFMVQCSLGNVQPTEPNAGDEGEASTSSDPPPSQTTPPWWPEDIPFSLPLVQPESINTTDWTRKLKELVCICYEYHNNVFLLRFCTVLSKYEPECLRFINNYNSTTSLYDRFNNKLLVTFRNENMLYDKEHNPNRICLLPRRKTGSLSVPANNDSEIDELEESAAPSMVEPPLFDIYLCDYCDAELYSLEACQDHEKNCRETSEQGGEEDCDSDVIICEDDDTASHAASSTIASAVKRRTRKKAATGKDAKAKKRKQAAAYEEVEVLDTEEDEEEEDCTDIGSEQDKENQMRSFLSHFQLVSSKGTPADNWPKQRSPRKSAGRSPVKQLEKIGAKGGKRPRNDRSVLTLQRCATVPMTSPMGKFLLKTQKTTLAPDYQQERIERMERFCMAPVVRDGVRPRWLTMAPSETFQVTYRALDYRGMFEKDEGYDPKYVHKYHFPRRQLSTKSRDEAWAALTEVLLKCCRPCTVDLVMLTETDIRVYLLHLAIERKKRELMELRKADLMRMFVQQERMFKRPPDECIDLCSSSDEDDSEGGQGKRRKLENNAQDEDIVVIAEEDETDDTASMYRKPGPKGAIERAAKRQRMMGADEDESKENRSVDQQFVKILPKPPSSNSGNSVVTTSEEAARAGFLGNVQLQPMRLNHSAIQSTVGSNGDLAKPLSIATIFTDSQWASQALGSPQTAAQMGVLLPSSGASPVLNHMIRSSSGNNGNSSGNNSNSSNNGITVSGINNSSKNIHQQHNHHQSASIGQPSSYLFLTKQQLVYQQLEVTSTVAENKVVPGDQVEEEVVGTTTTNSNSSLSGRVSTTSNNHTITGNSPVVEESSPVIPEIDQEDQSILAKQLLTKLNNCTGAAGRSSLETQQVTQASPVKDHQSIGNSSNSGGNSGNKVSARKSLPTRGAMAQSPSKYPPLPKKMPSLVRIAPA